MRRRQRTFHEWIQAEALTGWKRLAAMGALSSGIGFNGNKVNAEMPPATPMSSRAEELKSVKFSNDYSSATATVKRKTEHDKQAYWKEAKHKIDTAILNNTRLNDVMTHYDTPKFISKGEMVDVQVRIRYFRNNSGRLMPIAPAEIAEIAKNNGEQ